MRHFDTDKLHRLTILNFEKLNFKNPKREADIYKQLREISYPSQPANGVPFGSGHLAILVFFGVMTGLLYFLGIINSDAVPIWIDFLSFFGAAASYTVGCISAGYYLSRFGWRATVLRLKDIKVGRVFPFLMVTCASFVSLYIVVALGLSRVRMFFCKGCGSVWASIHGHLSGLFETGIPEHMQALVSVVCTTNMLCLLAVLLVGIVRAFQKASESDNRFAKPLRKVFEFFNFLKYTYVHVRYTIVCNYVVLYMSFFPGSILFLVPICAYIAHMSAIDDVIEKAPCGGSIFLKLMPGIQKYTFVLFVVGVYILHIGMSTCAPLYISIPVSILFYFANLTILILLFASSLFYWYNLFLKVQARSQEEPSSLYRELFCQSADRGNAAGLMEFYASGKFFVFYDYMYSMGAVAPDERDHQ